MKITAKKTTLKKNTVKLFALIALITLIVFTACDDGNNPGNTPDITWTLEQLGGEPGVDGGLPTADTTAILIKFSGAVSLTDADITIGGAALRDSSQALSSSGSDWTVPVIVSDTDNASVTIAKAGVESGPKTVMVYMEDKAPPITWTAEADGAASTVDSTKITFTFSEAVDNLTADDIDLAPINVSVTKGALSRDGVNWELGIIVSGQGYIMAAVSKYGVSATAQQVQVHKVAVNPVSGGGTSWINDGNQVVFSANGTYTMKTPKEEYNEDSKQWRPSVDGNNKYIWLPKVEGSYTWNQGGQTLTLTPETVADNYDDNRVMRDRTQAEPIFQNMMEQEVEAVIESEMTYGNAATREEAETFVLDSYNKREGTNCATPDELITTLAAIRLGEAFEPHSYTYTFSNDGVSLILLEALPPDVGADELASKTINGTIIISTLLTVGEPQLDPEQIYVFSATGKTYIATIPGDIGGTVTVTGTYSYDSSSKRVYLKPYYKPVTKEELTINQTPEQYYDDAAYYEIFNYYPSEADKRTTETYQFFKVTSYEYNPAANTISTGRGGGDIEPL